MAGAEGVHGGDGFRGAELQPARINLVHHGPGDCEGRRGIAHQPVVGGQAEVDSGPHLQGVGAVGIEGGAIAAQAIGHPQAAALETQEAGFFHGLQGGEGAIVGHHRWEPQQAGIEIAAQLVGHHHGGAAFGVDLVVLTVPEQGIKIGPGLLEPAAKFPLLP